MFAVLGEDESDTEALACLIRRIKNNNSLQVLKKGCSGCGELFKKGPAQIKAFHSAKSCGKFVICYDSDGSDAEARRQRIARELIRPSGVTAKFCAVVPVQELEAWFLADLSAIQAVLTGFRPNTSYERPESIADPKEHLNRITRIGNSRPRYSNALHNPHFAKHLNIAEVSRKCPSFVPFYRFIHHGECNT